MQREPYAMYHEFSNEAIGQLSTYCTSFRLYFLYNEDICRPRRSCLVIDLCREMVEVNSSTIREGVKKKKKIESVIMII